MDPEKQKILGGFVAGAVVGGLIGYYAIPSSTSGSPSGNESTASPMGSTFTISPIVSDGENLVGYTVSQPFKNITIGSTATNTTTATKIATLTFAYPGTYLLIASVSTSGYASILYDCLSSSNQEILSRPSVSNRFANLDSQQESGVITVSSVATSVDLFYQANYSFDSSSTSSITISGSFSAIMIVSGTTSFLSTPKPYSTITIPSTATNTNVGTSLTSISIPTPGIYLLIGRANSAPNDTTKTYTINDDCLSSTNAEIMLRAAIPRSISPSHVLTYYILQELGIGIYNQSASVDLTYQANYSVNSGSATINMTGSINAIFLSPIVSSSDNSSVGAIISSTYSNITIFPILSTAEPANDGKFLLTTITIPVAGTYILVADITFAPNNVDLSYQVIEESLQTTNGEIMYSFVSPYSPWTLVSSHILTYKRIKKMGAKTYTAPTSVSLVYKNYYVMSGTSTSGKSPTLAASGSLMALRIA